ncbi:unnamed protein product [Trichogramma brassicae]|uniref:Reverse transcriptase domain-containing protein n=1 Tax=Trichogramma brassicae TaxID=86971 RepID=A0A6H5IJ11_9HYME|nr:unnamed protein product [Trichogramma brassicae]
MVGARPVSRDVPYEKFSFRYVEPVEVVEAIARTRTDARGTDGIPVSSLRDCLIVILPVLLHIFDCSLQTGVFPTAWKSALVRPVPKIGLPRAAADFRPISLLCAASKVFERIVYLQIREYVDRNGLMDMYQSGFRRGHSTQTALLRAMDNVRAAVDVGHVTLLVAVDLSKAFDMVDFDVLIDRLGALGWSGMACEWTRSYLSGRTQRVVRDDGTVSAVPRSLSSPCVRR